jgi:hypothetical protein
MREEVRNVVISSVTSAAELSKALFKSKVMSLGSINASFMSSSPTVRYKTTSSTSTLNLTGMSSQVVPGFISPTDAVKFIDVKADWFVNDLVHLSWNLADIVLSRDCDITKDFCKAYCSHLMTLKSVTDTVKRLKNPFTKITMTKLDKETAKITDLGYNAKIMICDERFNLAMHDAKSFFYTEFIDLLQKEVGRLEFLIKDYEASIQRCVNFGETPEMTAKIGMSKCSIYVMESCQKELAAIVDSIKYQRSKLDLGNDKRPVRTVACSISPRGEWVD